MNELYNVNGWQKKLKLSFKIPFSAVLHYNEIHPDAKVFCKPDDKDDLRFKEISDPCCFKNLRKLGRAKVYCERHNLSSCPIALHHPYSKLEILTPSLPRIDVPILVKNRTPQIFVSAFAIISYIPELLRGLVWKPSPRVSQENSAVKNTACIFCESVWQRLQEGNFHSDLESLYLEHLKKYHGMTDLVLSAIVKRSLNERFDLPNSVEYF